jgi:putative membrane protein
LHKSTKSCSLEGSQSLPGIPSSIKNKLKGNKPPIKGINTAGQALHPPPAAASEASRGVLNPSFPHSLDHARASTVAISLRSSINRFSTFTAGCKTVTAGCKTVTAGYKTVTAGYKTVTAGYKTVTADYKTVTAGYKTFTAGYGTVTAGYKTATAGYGTVTAGYKTVTAGCKTVTAGYKTVTAGYKTVTAGDLKAAVSKVIVL